MKAPFLQLYIYKTYFDLYRYVHEMFNDIFVYIPKGLIRRQFGVKETQRRLVYFFVHIRSEHNCVTGLSSSFLSKLQPMTFLDVFLSSYIKKK